MLWLSCEGQMDVWELFSDNSYLSAIHDRQGLLVVVPPDLRTKMTESFSPQLLQGFWRKLKKKNPKIAVMSPTFTTQNCNQKESHMATVPSVLGPSEYQILGGEHFLGLGPESVKICWLKKVQYLQKKYHCQWTLLRGKKPKWIFHNFGNLLHPLELVPDSRKYVVPTEWQVRTVLGDSISKAEVISIQAPQYRQCALISDFLDVAKLSIGEEAVLAMNWIKDRPEGLTLQNLALATMTGPAVSSLPKNMTADVQYATNKCESLASRKPLSLHGNPSASAQDFSPHMWQSFDVIVYRICTSNAV